MPIPDTVGEFLDTLRPVRKPTTCANYLYELSDLHRWLLEQKTSLGLLDRAVMERWLQSLADRGLAPGTRASRICHVRRYLQWLLEHGTVITNPKELLRPSDFPKIPSTLPRPFPIEADRELQRRFHQSNTLYGQALFLMRRTGVRIGELIHLDPRCVESDLHGNAFLKVPLGKLDNERLVPLEDKTRRLAERLQQKCRSTDQFLLAPHLRRRTVKTYVREALRQLANGLDIPGPVTPHRLRHTYATELLNAGMSLVAIMKLLGHRSLRMTMRYAAITQDTVVKDYHLAMDRITAQYQLPYHSIAIDKPDPKRMLLDIISWLRNNAPSDHRTQRLIKRFYKIQDEIACINKRSSLL